MEPYPPASPPGAQPPPLWGDETTSAPPPRPGHRRRRATADGDRRRLRHSEAWPDFFKTAHGPVIVAYRNIPDDPARAAALDHDLAVLGAHYDRGTATTVMDWEYLLLTARTRSRAA